MMKLLQAASCAICLFTAAFCYGEEENPAFPKAFVDGNGPGWRQLTLDDFDHVNGEADTWFMKDGMICTTGKPVGVIRSKKKITNVEIVGEWRHLEYAGNSGIFLWAPDQAFDGIKPGQLPTGGIEVQILDLGYAERYLKETGKVSDWFTSQGDVFPVGSSKMTPFEPVAPTGVRSFPRKELTKGHGNWNHYYVRAINGEVRLWVNGEEVSGGNNCEPATGFMCLEAEGAPVEFRNLRIRELP
ncbi:3-keto-disaccharide hydrolase [Planctomicrobium sp. SH668]|uniref:3-keto-disaccharide hydrolase n=1 Tax=Planctomicrobium sp. SH668 TaxID=3448126 RepID=UPI003F5B22FC